jgi:FlaG/FlaF family flagellin (archaellin)
MNTRKRAKVLFVLAAMLASVTVGAVDSKKAEYVGGTISGIQEKAEGNLDTATEAQMVFTPERGRGPSLIIPYASITGLEYGQKAGRRVGAAILVNPLLLFSKKRKHFFTIGFKDKDGREQAIVLELGKDIVRTTLTVIETRSGKEIEYQDDEARKAGRGGN